MKNVREEVSAALKKASEDSDVPGWAMSATRSLNETARCHTKDLSTR